MLGVVDKELSPLTGPLATVVGGFPLIIVVDVIVIVGGGGEEAELQLYDMDMEVLARVRDTFCGLNKSSVKSHKHMRVSWPIEPIL